MNAKLGQKIDGFASNDFDVEEPPITFEPSASVRKLSFEDTNAGMEISAANENSSQFSGSQTIQSSDDIHVLSAEVSDVESTETEKQIPSHNVFFWIPFLTVMREGLESVLLIGGVSIDSPPSSIPLAAISGALIGCAIGYLLHRASGKLSLRFFFVIGSYILFLMAAGIFSRSIGKFEDWVWLNAIGGVGEASTLFDPRVNVWFLGAALSENTSSGMGVMNSLFGYRCIASIGTVVGYCGFWILLSAVLILMKWRNESRNRRIVLV